MNILSFDIEEWYLEKVRHGDRPSRYKLFDGYLSNILDLLDERNIKGTFFCLGEMGRHYPEVVKRIAERGHDIGCHSNIHTWLNKMSREEVYEDTRIAVDTLEQCLGRKITSYRAPAFSIGRSNIWAFEVLAECGIERDASVFPAVRDFGGFADFGSQIPSVVRCGGVELKEFPICTTHLFGKETAYSGGGYFRFFPLWYIKQQMKGNDYNMCYFHIDDLIPEQSGVMTKQEYEEYFKEKGTWAKRHLRYFKSNVGKAGSFDKMVSLVRCMDFVSLEKADRMIDWSQAPIVNL